MDPSSPSVSQLTRRRLLTGASRVAAAAAASALMPPNVRRLLAQAPPSSGSLNDIKHVVLLMQENRSFDHYFGTLAGVRGFDDPHALTAVQRPSPSSTSPTRKIPTAICCPFHLDTRTTSAQKIPSTSHAWAVQHEAWNGGKMDNWLPAHRKADGAKAPTCMGYHTRADIPFQFALAEAFTICDAYHCSVMGPTWPNRMYWMTGTIDPEGKDGGPMINNTAPAGGFTWTTYAERLEQAGVSWKVYQQQDNYGCNMLENFQGFPAGRRRAPPLHTQRQWCAARKASSSTTRCNDKLPAVSWIIPTSINPSIPDYMPAAGAAFVASKIDAIAANPEVWAKTVFILNYDENDGIFDHVPPPVPPRGTPHEFVGRLPDRRRVPRSVHHRLALDRRRLGLQPAVRPHLGAAIPGKIHRRPRAEHHRLAAQHLRRSDVRLSNPPGKHQGPLFARRPRTPDPGQVRNCAFA